MNPYKRILEIEGLSGRVSKLREECIELALACDRYLSNKGPLENIYEETADVFNVAHSLVPANFYLYRDAAINKLKAHLETIECQDQG